jgi:chromosome segregation ATPase
MATRLLSALLVAVLVVSSVEALPWSNDESFEGVHGNLNQVVLLDEQPDDSATNKAELERAASSALVTHPTPAEGAAKDASDRLNGQVDQANQDAADRKTESEKLHAKAEAAESDAAVLATQVDRENSESASAAEGSSDVIDEISEQRKKVADSNAKLANLRQDAHDAAANAARIQEQVEDAHKATASTAKAARAQQAAEEAEHLMKELDAAKKGAALNGAKLKVLEAQSKVHRTAAAALETKQKQLNNGKQEAAVEVLEDEIRHMDLQKAKLEEENADGSDTLAAEEKSHKLASISTNKAAQEARTLEQKRDGLSKELETLQDQQQQQLEHLQKVKSAAKVNSEAQSQTLENAAQDFKSKLRGLSEQVDEMQKNVKVKMLKLTELGEKEKRQHADVVRETDSLRALSGTLKMKTMQNKKIKSHSAVQIEAAKDKLAEVTQEADKAANIASLVDAKLQVATSKFRAIKAVQEHSQAESKKRIQKAQSAVDAAKSEDAELTTSTSKSEQMITEHEQRSIELVKHIAHLRLQAAPHQEEATKVNANLDDIRAKYQSAKQEAREHQQELTTLKATAHELDEKMKDLERKLPIAKGEMEASAKTVEQRKHMKEQTKLKALDAVEKLRQASAQFSKLAPEAVASKQKLASVNDELKRVSEGIAETQAAIHKEQVEHTAKMASLKEHTASMEQHLKGLTGNKEEQHKEIANVMAQIEVLGESIAKGKLKFAAQKQEHAATIQHIKQEVAKLSEVFATDSDAAKQAEGDVEAFKTQSASAHAEEEARNQAEIADLQTKRSNAEKKQAETEAEAEETKKKVASNLADTIAREKAMEKLREDSIKKMEDYAGNVEGKMKNLVAHEGGEKSAVEAKEAKLQTELSDIKVKETKEEIDEKKRSEEVKTLQMKEAAAAKEGKDAIKQNVDQIIQVDGGKVDGEIAMTRAEENKEKRQIARLAAELKKLQDEQAENEQQLKASAEENDRLDQDKQALGEQLSESDDDLKASTERDKELTAKAADAEKQIRKLEEAKRKKEALLAKLIAEEGADSEKVKAMQAELAENDAKRKSLEARASEAHKKLAKISGKLSADESSEEDLQRQLDAANEADLKAKEALKLEKMQLADAQANLEARKAKARAEGADLSKFEAEEAALAAKEAEMQEKEASAGREAAKAKLAASEKERQAKLAELAAKAAQGDLSDAEKELQEQLVDEQREHEEMKQEDEKKAKLEAKLENLLGAENAEKRKGELHEKVMNMLMKTEGLLGKSPEEMKALYEKTKQKLLNDRLQLHEILHQEQAVKESAAQEEQKLQQVEEGATAAAQAADRQKAKDAMQKEAALAQIEQAKGETDEEFAERKRLRAEVAQREKRLGEERQSVQDAKKREFMASAAHDDMTSEASRLSRRDDIEAQALKSDEAHEAKVKAQTDSLKEELVKKKVEVSLASAEDKRMQEQLKQLEQQKADKTAALEKARKTLMIAQTANQGEHKAVLSAEADVRSAEAEGKVQTDHMRRKVAAMEQEERELAARMQNAAKEQQEKDIKVAALKDHIGRVQSELEEESVQLEGATKDERSAKDNKLAEEHKQKELGKQVDAVKNRADAVAQSIEQKKKEADELSERGTEIQAQTEAESARIKAKIAEAQAKQAASEEAIKQINQQIFETQEDTKNRKTNIAKLKASKFTNERELNGLKKQVSVLKAFLTGPMLTSDGP